jgi:hypothetical protein
MINIYKKEKQQSSLVYKLIITKIGKSHVELILPN